MTKQSGRAKTTLVNFAGLARPVAFHGGAERLLDHLAMLARGWGYQTVPAGLRSMEDADPAFVVSHEEGLYRIDAPWLDEPVEEATELRACANLTVDLAEAWLDERPSTLSLHCGAALFAGRLVVFPSRARAGKSTLTARLAASGLTVFTDDILPIEGGDDGLGLSLGIAPRLRLPLPPRAGVAFRQFVTARRGPGEDSWLYLDLPPEIGPQFGRKAPLGAIVLLDRMSEGPASLSPASAGDGLQELIRQNLSPELAMPDLVERLHRLVGRLPCYRLRYADLDDAFDALRTAFTSWDSTPIDQPSNAPSPSSPTRPSAPSKRGQAFLRHPTVVLHDVDDGLFLVKQGDDAVFRLNAIAAGVWRLLAEPTSAEEAVEILYGAFPDLDRGRIRTDIKTLFSELAQRGLIIADPAESS